MQKIEEEKKGIIEEEKKKRDINDQCKQQNDSKVVNSNSDINASLSTLNVKQANTQLHYGRNKNSIFHKTKFNYMILTKHY